MEPKKTTQYVTGKELLEAVIEAKQVGRLTDKLAKMLLLLCTRYSLKGSFVGYTYREDMVAYAMMMLCRTWNSFNPEKSNQAFSYYTQSVHHSFVQFLNQEKKQRNVRDALLVNQGLSPSYAYAESCSSGHHVEDEEDYDAMQEIEQKLTVEEKDPMQTLDEEQPEEAVKES